MIAPEHLLITCLEEGAAAGLHIALSAAFSSAGRPVTAAAASRACQQTSVEQEGC